MRRILILLLVLTTNTVAWAESKSPTVAVAPFVINSQQSLPKVRSTLQKLLVDQLSKQGVTVVEAAAVNHALKPGVFVNSETQARSLGRHVQADYVIYGSFNKIGNSISIDASLVNVAGVKKTEVLVGGKAGWRTLHWQPTKWSSRPPAIFWRKPSSPKSPCRAMRGSAQMPSKR